MTSSTASLFDTPTQSAPADTIEQAKGALMLRYGVNSQIAFATLARWAAEAGADVAQIAHVLMHGICQGHVAVEARERHLVRWLEEQLRQTLD